jgi:hypothetical protein
LAPLLHDLGRSERGKSRANEVIALELRRGAEVMDRLFS